jgi:hypothetical protein
MNERPVYQRAIADAHEAPEIKLTLPVQVGFSGTLSDTEWRPLDAQWFTDIVSDEVEAYERARAVAEREPLRWPETRKPDEAFLESVIVCSPSSAVIERLNAKYWEAERAAVAAVDTAAEKLDRGPCGPG